jgi:ferric-dicitrate binding protein FerR (iron transport regulator)
MPLSEHEQRLLDQIERALYAEDPKFASTVRGRRLRRPSRRRRLQGIALFGLGVALLVLGVVLLKPGSFPWVSLLGFLGMFFGALLTLAAMRRGDAGTEAGEGSGAPPSGKEKPGRSSFSQRMEERFRRRFDQE